MDFSKIAEYLSHPLVLIGFALFILYSLFKNFIVDRIKILTHKSGDKFMFRLLNSIVLIIVLLIILGFGLKYHELNNKDSSYDLSKNVIYKKIVDIEQKKESFVFNVSDKDSVKLIFQSNKWDFESKFIIDNQYKVADLKNAIVRHFELEKHIRTKNDESLLLTWLLSSNNVEILDENRTLKNAGINNNDIITLSVTSKHISVEKGLDEKINGVY
ncbi:hypothetical protein [Jejuia spongiicola]|uniref:Ubiquitin-like domain-containing protein n=1 Tax=Jejuia spongiicola TaxID=2942207 RepID=A0ABT0QGC9_9FLAO|nr:hypothetical protein [Jejuia spongiicola]MCL6296055.1 hypothetical protein [Jejuia spongiicola]